MADRNPSRLSNWKLRCTGCGATWLSKEKMVDVQEHWKTVHDGNKVKLELVWVGKGKAPIPPPEVKI